MPKVSESRLEKPISWSRKETMDQNWKTYAAWIAHFDILGFKEDLKKTYTHDNYLWLLQCKIDDILVDFQKEADECHEDVDCLFYADTFIFYSRSDENRTYPAIIHTATHFMEKCLYKGFPLRGAISYGNIAVGYDKRCLMGQAFHESHEYGEDQDWIGLVLTPSASKKVKEIGLNPTHHGFINRDIPMRKYSEPRDEIYAYTFCRGVTNFACPHLEILRSLKQQSPEYAKLKYENTIKFIEKYHQRMN